MKQHQRAIGKNDEWITPPQIVRSLGEFDLDPCSPIETPIRFSEKWFTIEDDGIKSPWDGRVWLNPPFNRYERPRWMRKMAEHGNGIMLIPAATETDAFDRWVWKRADAVCFVKGRPHFYYVDGVRAKANCGTAIALVAYGEDNVRSLELSGLGRVVRLTSRTESSS